MITETDKLKCAERELRWRKRVYRNRLETGRMNLHQVRHEIACMEAIIEDYKERAKKEQLPLPHPRIDKSTWDKRDMDEWLGDAPQTR